MNDDHISTSICTNYRGKTIYYHEDSSEWRCEDFINANRGSPSLALAKARVDKMLDGKDIWEGLFNRDYNHATHWRRIVLP